jgi:hypothetical protein
MTKNGRRAWGAAGTVGAALVAGGALLGACSFATSTEPGDAGGFDAATFDVTFHLPDAEAGATALDAADADAAVVHEAGPEASVDASADAGADAAQEAGPSCSFGAACTPGACQVGVTQCDGGTQFCQALGDTAAGTSCGDGGVCSGAGACVACSPGADCTDAGSCAKATIVCTSGSPVCAAAGNEPNGTPCGKDLYCTGGACTSCTPGATCVPAGKPCDVGTVSCSTGFACNDTGTATADGTTCGTNQVCKGGQCVACTSGGSCHPNGNLCQTGTTSCTTGTQTCGALVDVANGTPCGNGQVCNAGQCVACQTGAACTPPGNLCDRGAISCASGSPVCVDTGSPAVTCTASDACHVAGTCNPGTGKCSNPDATNGTPCNDGDACTTGDRCTTGVCGGTPVTCTASDQCHVAGTCDPSSGTCSNPVAGAGTSCNDGDACTTGDQCSNGVCGGTPVTCTASDQCHVAGACSGGVCSNPIAGNGTLCNGGTGTCQGGACACTNPLVACGASCVNLTTDSANCGGCGNACPVLSAPSRGATCTPINGNGVCVGDVGGYDAAGGLNPTVSSADIYAMQISFPKAGTVTELHVVMTGGGFPMNAVMGLYADGGGAPGTILSKTAITALPNGDSALPLLTPTPVSATTYWVAFSAAASGQTSVQSSTGTCTALADKFTGELPGSWLAAGRTSCPGAMGLYAVTDF